MTTSNEVGMLWELVALAGVHFLGDFVLQNNWMALNKSKSLKALGAHVGVYTLCFFPRGVYFMLALFFLHFVTDFFTSRLTSRLWFLKVNDMVNVVGPGKEEWILVQFLEKKRHWFFVAIGFDQLLHLVQIAFLLHIGI